MYHRGIKHTIFNIPYSGYIILHLFRKIMVFNILTGMKLLYITIYYIPFILY